MRPTRLLLLLSLAVVSAVLCAASVCVAQEFPPLATSAEVTDDALAELPPELEEIAGATSPSAAVEAYARARAAMPDSLAVEQVYVRRMVELGAPDMCAAQARHIVAQVRDNGLAWAVLAFNAARGADYTAALTHLVEAVRYQPRDPFVQQTAGQLLAWYETRGDSAQVSADLREALRRIRLELAGQPEFDAAYQEARTFYRQGEESAESTWVEPLPSPTVTAVRPVVRNPVYVEREYVYPAYTPVYTDYPWYAGTCSWLSTRTNLIVVPRDRDLCRPYHRLVVRRTCLPRRYQVTDGDVCNLRPPGFVAPGSRHVAPRVGYGRRPAVGLARPGRSERTGGGEAVGGTRRSTPGVKPLVAPGLKPPVAPGLKPPSAPGWKPPAAPNPGRRPGVSAQPLRTGRPAGSVPARRAPTSAVRPMPNPRGR
jgi:hypothetical protein